MSRRRGHKKWYFLLSMLVVVLCLLLFASMYAEQRLDAARAKLALPESVQRYQQLANALGAESGVPPAEDGAAPAPLTDTPIPPEEIAAARDSIGAFKAFEPDFAARVTNDETWSILTRDFPDSMADWSAEEWETAKAFLEERADLVAEVRALAARGGPYYPLDFEEGFSMMLPHLGQIRGFARLLRIDAGVQAREGKWDAVEADLIAQARFAAAVNEEPILISQLVGIAIQGMTIHTVTDIAPPGTLDPELGARLVQALAASRNRDQMAAAMAMEANAGTDLFDALRSGEVTPFESRNPVAEWLFGSSLGQIVVDLDEATYLDIMTPLSDLARMPYYEAIDSLDAIEDRARDLPVYKPFSRMLIPAVSRALAAPARGEAELELFRIGLAIEQHYVEHGSYPGSLDGVAGQLGGIPLDPFSGAPYLYVPGGGGFTLYSVGQNMIDDQGRHHWVEGDIVWRGREG